MQLAPIARAAGQVPGVARLLAKLKPLQTVPWTQAEPIASAPAGVQLAPCANFLRQSPPFAALSQKRPDAHCSSDSQEACAEPRTEHLLPKASQWGSSVQSELPDPS